MVETIHRAHNIYTMHSSVSPLLQLTVCCQWNHRDTDDYTGGWGYGEHSCVTVRHYDITTVFIDSFSPNHSHIHQYNWNKGVGNCILLSCSGNPYMGVLSEHVTGMSVEVSFL